MQKAMVGRHSLHFFLAFSGFIGIFFFGYSLGVQRQNAGLPRVDDAPAVHGTNIRGPQRVAKSQGHSQNFGKNEEEQTSSVPSRPDGWEEYSRTDVREHYECRAYARDHKRAMPTMEYWHLLRKQYNDIVDGTANLDDPVPPTHGYTLDENGAPPFHAKYADDKGRGLFASRDIKKGELVHDGTNSDVVFPNATLWRQFIFSLPKNMACDVTEWQWTQALTEGGNLRICLAPSIASLMNTSHKSPNILPKSNLSTKMYAQRDIKEGEEILMDYSIYPTNWRATGL